MPLPGTNWRVSLVALLLGAGAVASFSGTASAAPGRKTPAPLVVTTGTLRFTGRCSERTHVKPARFVLVVGLLVLPASPATAQGPDLHLKPLPAPDIAGAVASGAAGGASSITLAAAG
jgi:hypothetical protein